MSLGFTWWQDHVTSEVYVNTHRSDWWKACIALAHALKGTHSLLDVGGGDGHSLWQILSVLGTLGTKPSEVSIIEPDATALRLARTRLRSLSIRSVRTYQGTFRAQSERMLANRTRVFDTVLVCQANYYLGMRGSTGYCRVEYLQALDRLLELGKRVVIQTSSGGSDYYKLTVTNPFGPEVFSEKTIAHYRSKGRRVSSKKISVRHYVAHAEWSPAEAALLWQFFNNTTRNPSGDEMSKFMHCLREVRGKSDYVNFKDELIVVE